MRYTNGPWAVNPLKATVDAFTEDGPIPVCGMLWPTKKRTEAETEANADLIAAAPDMYEALKEARMFIQGIEGSVVAGCFCEDMPTYEEHDGILQKIDLILARAEGRENNAENP